MKKLLGFFYVLCFIAVPIVFPVCDFANQAAIAAAYNFRATTSVYAGDVVVWDSTTAYGVATTTVEASGEVAGISAETVAAGTDCTIRQDGGRVTVNVTGSVAKGDWLITSTTAGKAAGVDSLQAGVFARAITDSGTPSEGRVYASINLGLMGYGGAGGAPTDACYSVTQAHPGLSNEKIHPNTGSPNFDIDHAISDVSGLQSALDGKLDKSGGTMTGALILAADPNQDMEAATKKYVDDNGGAGEANTASNLGSGVGVYEEKSGVELRFNSLAAGSSKVSISEDDPNNEIDIDIVESDIVHQNISGAGNKTHSEIDTHLDSTTNPHAVTASQAGAIEDIADAVDETHVDWGGGANQVSADDVPDGVTNVIVTATQETNWDNHLSGNGNPHAVTLEQARTAGDTLSGPVDFAGYSAVRMVCDNGASFPASPGQGQWFYHTTANTLYQYSDSAWIPIVSHGALDLYVDGVNGSDSAGQGYGLSSDATATVQYAIDLIPPVFSGDVTVTIAAGVYSETAIVLGKQPGGNYSITIGGTFSEGSELTASAGVKGDQGTQGTITVSGAGWSSDEHKLKWIKFEDDTVTSALQGDIRVVYANTSDTLTIVGTFDDQPASGDTFRICTQGTTINNISPGQGQKNVIVERVKTTAGIGASAYTYQNINCCHIYHSTGLTIAPTTFAYLQSNTCVFENIRISVSNRAQYFTYRDYHYHGTSTAVLYAYMNSSITIRHGTVIDGNNNARNGVQMGENSIFQPYSSNINGWNRIENCDIGLYVFTGAGTKQTDDILFSNNNTDKDVEASTYAWDQT